MLCLAVLIVGMLLSERKAKKCLGGEAEALYEES